MPPRSQVRRNPGQAPIIPEIAQAYRNDPRTQLAQQAIANGVDTAPVAEGQYAWADAAARALSAGLGGFQDKRLRDQYGKQDDATVSERAAAAEVALAALNAERTAQQAAPPPPQTPQPQPQAADPGQAQAIAGALGAPPPAMASAPPMGGQQPPPGPAGLPMAPPPPQAAPAPAPRPQQRGVALADPLGGTGRPTDGYGARRSGGRTHNGIDLAAPQDTPVAAAAEGRVLRAWNDTANGGGNSVIIQHPDGSRTGYAHLAAFNVRPGDTVAAGQPIGAVGSTGRSSGPHLHFTVRDASGRRLDPRTVIGQAAPAATDAAQNAAADEATELPGIDVTGTPGASQDYGIPAEAMPTAPQAVGATRSRGLQASLELAAAANPYESARAQTGITAGFDQQTDLDERAAARQNDTNMTGYRSALDRYAGDRTQLRGQRFQRGERLGGQEFARDERIEGQQYQSTENERNRGFQREERIGSQQFNAQQAALDRIAARSNLELQVGSREEIARQRALATPTGMRAVERANAAVQSNADTISRIDEFLAINSEQNTGGIRERLPFGADTFGSQRLQRMEAIGNQLAIDLSSQLKGALSDRDMETVRNGGLNITRTREANRRNGAFMRLAAERASDYQASMIEALGRGDRGFTRDWASYRDAVPLGAGAPTFEEWKASMPRYDAQGRPVQ